MTKKLRYLKECEEYDVLYWLDVEYEVYGSYSSYSSNPDSISYSDPGDGGEIEIEHIEIVSQTHNVSLETSDYQEIKEML